MQLIVFESFFASLIGWMSSLLFLSIGCLFLCAKKKGIPETKSTNKQLRSMKKTESDNKPAPEEPPKKEKSKSKSKSKLEDQKEHKKGSKDKSKHVENGKTDPFEGEHEDEEGGDGTSRKQASKSNKKGGKGKLGMPNKDGYDDLNPNKKPHAASPSPHGGGGNGFGPGVGAPPEDEGGKSKGQTDETKSKLVQPKNKDNEDDGYDAVDPNKNVNLQNVNMNETKGTPKGGASPAPASSKPNKPRQIPRDAKQQAIAKGAQKGKGDYPTFDDVISDWDSKKEESPAGGEKSKVKPSRNVRNGKKPATITEGNSEKEEKFQLKSREKSKKEKERTEPTQ